MSQSDNIKGLFVVASDTAAGKTTFSRAFLAYARSVASPFEPRKPVESGCTPLPLDALALRRASGTTSDLKTVCPHQLQAALSPALAMQREGRHSDLNALVAACTLSNENPRFIESAGGLLSPITGTHTNLDLAKRLGMPLIVAIPNRLGAINQAAMAITIIETSALPIRLVVLCDVSPTPRSQFEDNAPSITAQTGHTPIHLPWFPDLQNDKSGDEILRDHITAHPALKSRIDEIIASL